MNFSKKNLIKILPIISSVFIFNGCMPRQADGSYPTTYSYHPYNKIYKAMQEIKKNPTPRITKRYNQSRWIPKQSIQEIEKLAISQMGKRYKWGANGPYTFDCSGFTKFVYSKNGITLPRVSREQAKVGKFVSYRNLKKGDLLFFDSSKSSKVSHTGIYLGNHKFIHASSRNRRVVISSIGSNYYSKHFKWGRRLIQ